MNVPEVYSATVSFKDSKGKEVMEETGNIDHELNEKELKVADFIRIAPHEYFNVNLDKVNINSVTIMDDEPYIE